MGDITKKFDDFKNKEVKKFDTYNESIRDKMKPKSESELEIAKEKKLEEFSAKDIDGDIISDEQGNTIFEAVSKPTSDNVMGLYVNCKPIRSK